MGKREKPILHLPTLASLDDADVTLAVIAGHKRQLALSKLSADEEIAAIRLRLAAEQEAIKDEIEQLEQSLMPTRSWTPTGRQTLMRN